jgi:hypothetical protein
MVCIVSVTCLRHADADGAFDSDETEQPLDNTFFDAILRDAFACSSGRNR